MKRSDLMTNSKRSERKASSPTIAMVMRSTLHDSTAAALAGNLASFLRRSSRACSAAASAASGRNTGRVYHTNLQPRKQKKTKKKKKKKKKNKTKTTTTNKITTRTDIADITDTARVAKPGRRRDQHTPHPTPPYKQTKNNPRRYLLAPPG